MFRKLDLQRLLRPALALTAVLCAAPAFGQVTLNVNDSRDLEDFDFFDGQCDADNTLAGSQCTLRAALQLANFWGGWYVVQLGATTYGIDHWGTDDDCEHGDLDVYPGFLTKLEVRGVPALTVIDAAPLAAGGHPERVFHLLGTLAPTVEIEFKDLIIRGGRAGGGRGGGIRHEGGKLTLTNVTLMDSQAMTGGGIYVASPLTMTGGDIVSNFTTALGSGGGAYVAASSGVIFSGVLFMSNSATERGGALRLEPGAAATVASCLFNSNTAPNGGAISTRGSVSVGTSTFEFNTATGGGNGGGVSVEAGSSYSSFGSVLRSNVAANGGGAINVTALGGASLIDCTIDSNTASFGGGIADFGDVQLERSTVSRNTSTGSLGGAGVYVGAGFRGLNSTISSNNALGGTGGGLRFSGVGPAEMNSCTVAMNTSSVGGAGVYSTGPVLVKSTLIAGNRFGLATQNFAGTTPMTSHGSNLDSDGTCLLMSAPGNHAGSVAVPLDPMLGPLQNNGGVTETHAIMLTCTAALDQGACDTIGGTPLVTDQRGQLRVAPCDIGAYEASAILSGPTISTFCHGDNSGTPCPCAPAPAGSVSGCLHSFGTGGSLNASGTTSLTAQNLSLDASSLPPFTTVVFFQGTEQVNGGLGLVNGDGLSCAGGPIVRLGTLPAFGAVSYPPPGGIPVSVKGFVTEMGSVRDYQAYFRNAAAYCTPATYNLTNGVHVRWCP